MGNLAFREKLEFTNCNRLLFTAFLTISPPLSRHVLVKLVSGHYGDDVHRLLAEHDFAPILHAHSSPEGVPSAYIMEYLEPSSWTTLFEYSTLPNALTSTAAAAIHRSLDKILSILENNSKVHGDFRSVNIMVHVFQTDRLVVFEDDSGVSSASIKLIDFDWGGDAGKVCYPLLRNSAIDGLT